MIKRLPPVQFNFYAWWTEYRQEGFAANKEIEKAFSKLKHAYEEISLWAYEEAVENGFKEEAMAEYGLELHTALVKYKDMHWLRKSFEGCDLAPLSLAIACTVYPEEKWEILEDDELAIVANDSRTIVFDLKNFDSLSASASLVLLNDLKSQKNEDADREAAQFREIMLQKELQNLSILAKLLADTSAETEILKFDKN